MFKEIWQFICEVIKWWTHWGTGGLLLFVTVMAQAFRNKPFKRAVQLSLFFVFLLMAFFSAWEDAREKQHQAESEAIGQKQRADYNQKRIDRIQDAQIAQKSAVHPKVFMPETNHNGMGDENTVVGNVGISSMGDRNTIVGPTDNRGNTILNTPMAIGYDAHAGSNSISIGAYANTVNQSSNVTVKNNADNIAGFSINVGTISGGNNQLGNGNTMIVTNAAGAVFKAELVFNKDFVTQAQGAKFVTKGTFRFISQYPVKGICIGATGSESVSFWPNESIWANISQDHYENGYMIHCAGIASPGDYKLSVISTTMSIRVAYDIK
jgi:hypothetical protein